MDFFKFFEMVSLGIYSALGVAAFMAMYLLAYGTRCLDAWMKRQPMPTDRVVAYLVAAALIGLLAGSLVQGLVDFKTTCEIGGRTLGTCLFQG
ncbi:hypothetical protein MXB02_14255 [Pseudomonas mosselii]|uniref:hypothetical protein n=1 Tax=Pseudomonas mosselii TaxID=78327 RepID=UPI001FF789CB|nr:hypothetical protein [Pseudomonas mosselii]UPF01761.1 hypothetical protein MXB02_14255 [Pseudomonas mosselii]